MIQGFNVQNLASTPVDAAYLLFQREIGRIRPTTRRFALPRHPVSRIARRIVGTTVFRSISTAFTVINVLLMLGDYLDKPVWLEFLLFIQSLLFLCIFAIEILMMLVAYGPGLLIDEGEAIFDILVFIGAALGFFLDYRITTVFQVPAFATLLFRLCSSTLK